MQTREIYPNPPLRLVAVELRFPVTRQAASVDVWDAFEEAFGSDLPEVDAKVKVADDVLPRGSRFTPVFVRTSEERDRAVTLRYGALNVEFSRYGSYEDLRHFLARALHALETLPQARQITRVGIRYVNEIRRPPDAVYHGGVEFAWRDYIHPGLFPVLNELPEALRTSWFSAGLGFHSATSLGHTYLAYGATPTSSVESDGPLILNHFDEPCFLLDIDSYQAGRVERPVADSEPEVLATLDRLHDSVEAVFNYCITDKLRDEVLRRSRQKDDEEDAEDSDSGGLR